MTEASPLDPIAQADAVAERVRAVLFTSFPDAETLELLRPGAGPLEEVRAAQREGAAALARAGVQILVQRADRAGFRRWQDAQARATSGQPDPLLWRDRQGGYLQGEAALRELGLPASLIRRPALRGSGSPAERLVRAFAANDAGAMQLQVEALLAEGRQGVLDQAARRLAERYQDEAVEAFEYGLMASAGSLQGGPSGWVTLITLPAGLPPTQLPDGAALIESLLAAGAMPEQVELRLLPEWRDPALLRDITPCALRGALQDLLAGRAPAALPPADPQALLQGGIGMLIGLEFDWRITSWEQLLAGDLPPPEPLEEDAADEAEMVDPQIAALEDAYDAWSSRVFQETNGCVPMPLTPASDTLADIDDFTSVEGVDELRQAIEMAQQEAGEETVVGDPDFNEGGLALGLYTESGRYLDTVSIPIEQLPLPEEDMREMLAQLLPLRKA